MLAMNYKKYALVDLHLHLDGSLSAEAIIKVAKEENIKLPAYTVEELNPYLMVPEDCPSLNEYLKRFDLPNLVLQTKNGLKTCTLDLLERLSKQGLKYVEVRMAPQLSCDKGLTQEEVVETLIEALNEGEKFGIYSNLILCMMRGKNTQEKNIKTIEVAKKFLGSKVVALDLAGAEALFPNDLFKKEFKLANKYGIPLTIHCGEADGANSVHSALKFKPVRIGHGIHAIESKKAMKKLKIRGICLEICPKSNVDTKAVSSLKEIPIRQFMEQGIKVSINTDDDTCSNTKLEKEYQSLAELGFTEKELQQFAINSVEASFASDEIKSKILGLIR